MKWIARLLLGLGLLLALGLIGLYSYRPGMAEYQRHRVATAPIPAGALTATWLGVTALLLRDACPAVTCTRTPTKRASAPG